MNLAAKKTKAMISITLILLSSIALSASLSVEAQVTGVETQGGSPQMAALAPSVPAGVNPNVSVASTADYESMT